MGSTVVAMAGDEEGRRWQWSMLKGGMFTLFEIEEGADVETR